MINKKIFLSLFILTLIAIILRLPSIDVPLDADSGANAFFARQMLEGETLYERFHPAHHLPGIYYTFVLSFKLFGDSQIAPKLLLLPFIVFCIGLMYWFGYSSNENFIGLLSAFFFILLSSQSYLDGMTVQIEHFANLPLISSFLLLIVLVKKDSSSVQFIWVGILTAISILYKVIFVAPLVVAIVSILLVFWLERFQLGALKRLFSRIAWLAIGVLLPLTCVAGYFISLGLWQRLILIFTLGFSYIGDQSTLGNLYFFKPFGFPLFMLSWNNFVLLIIGLLGTYRLLRKSFPLTNKENVIDISIALWLIISLALTGIRGAGYPHYLITAFPPLALVAGIEINTNYVRWKKTSSKQQANLSISLMIGLVITLFLVSNNTLYRAYFPYKLGYISYQEFSNQISSFSIKDAQPVAEYVKSHTNPDDYIYAWSKSVQIYYFADRLPPIDIIWTSYISATGSPERIFTELTKYIIVDPIDEFPRPAWLIDGLSKYYVLETVILEKEIYRRLLP